MFALRKGVSASLMVMAGKMTENIIDKADESTLKEIVGSTTFARGRKYANSGAVVSREFGPGKKRVFGTVQGGELRPYLVSAEIIRGSANRLRSFSSKCSCPVGIDCKHGVALVLAKNNGLFKPTTNPERSLALVQDELDLNARFWESVNEDRLEANHPVTRKDSKVRPAEWETPFQGLLGGDKEYQYEDSSISIGLQFEPYKLQVELASRRIGTELGVRIRPVIRTSTGSWSRNGISWWKLDLSYFVRQAAPFIQEHVDVIKELISMASGANNNYRYSRSDSPILLQGIKSKRLWDLLREARDIHLPLLMAGKSALVVSVYQLPVAISIDVTRDDATLNVEPRIVWNSERLELSSCCMIGSPSHGIAWLSGLSSDLGGQEQLYMAPFDSPVDDYFHGLLGYPEIKIPRRNEKHFFTDIYPILGRRVNVESSDGSVEFPELPHIKLRLLVISSKVGYIELRWVWIGKESGFSSLYEDSWRPRIGSADSISEVEILEAVKARLESLPGFFETTYYGQRLREKTVLNGMDCVKFYTDVLPLLREIDDVEVDEQSSELEYRELADAPVISIDGYQSKENDWFDLTVTVQVEGEDVPFKDLFIALAQDQTHLILPSGSFFSLDRDELRQLAQLIAEARALEDSSGDSVRLSRFHASFWEELRGLGVVSAQARAWEASVRELTDVSIRKEHDVPKGFCGTLRPYQVAGFNWLAFLFDLNLGGILADDMGLGKTLQALAVVCHTREQSLTKDPYLVVAPTSVVGNWVSECHKFAPGLKVASISETLTRRQVPIETIAADADIVVSTYALYRLEYDQYASISWAGMFLDEAQFIKNRQSKAFQRVKMLPVAFKVAMTGTPFENNLMELWSLLSITSPGLFRSPDRFEEYYRKPIERKADPQRMDQLRRRIRPLMLRRTKEQVVRDLPAKQEQVLDLELNPKHKKIYQVYLQRERQKVLGLIGDLQKNRFEIFRSLTLLRQASLDVSLVDPKHDKVPSTKLDALMEMLDDIVEEGHRVLVYSQFTTFLRMAGERLRTAGIEYCYLDGRTRKRENVINTFRNGSAPAFLISLKAGGFGLNLTEADYCIILDPWWNPATEAQAVDRVHRIGQTKKVMVYRLVAKDTIEDKVMALKAKKEALFSNIMDDGVFESGAMTAADIQELLS